MSERGSMTLDEYSPVTGDESQARQQLITLIQDEGGGDQFEEKAVSAILSHTAEERITLRSAIMVFTDHVVEQSENPESLATDLASEIKTGGDQGEMAPSALASVMCANRPESVKPLCESLVYAVREGDLGARKYALSGAARIAQQYSSELTPIASDIDMLLLHDISSIRLEASKFAKSMSEPHPEAIAHAVPELYKSLGFSEESKSSDRYEGIQPESAGGQASSPAMWDQKTMQVVDQMQNAERRNFHSKMIVRENAAVSLVRIAEADPGSVADGIESSLQLLQKQGDPNVQGPLLESIRMVTEWQPDEYPSKRGINVITNVLTDWDAPEQRKQAAFVLAHVAEHRPNLVVPAVSPHTDRVAELLANDYPLGRYAGATILSHVAERDPEAVTTPPDRLIKLLDDDYRIVRGAALWALRYIGTPKEKTLIQEVAANDPDPEISDLAEEAARDLSRNNR